MSDVRYGTEFAAELPSDAELEALAMGAPIELISEVAPEQREALTESLLPGWYMPAPARRLVGSWRGRIVIALVITLLAIEIAGLCTTYGPIG